MATHRQDVAVGLCRPSPSTADTTVTEWVADLSIPGSSADPTRTTPPLATLVAGLGYVGDDVIDTRGEPDWWHAA